MQSISNFKFKTKIIIVIFSIGAISTIVGSAINYYNDISSTKKQLIENTFLQARLISENCWFPMEFNYPANAEEVLQKLYTIPSIHDVVLYDIKDSVFASYHKKGEVQLEYDRNFKFENYFIKNDYLNIKLAIIHADKNYGHIYIRSYIDWSGIIYDKLFISITVLSLILIVIFILAYLLEKYISSPILDLTNEMKKVVSERDFSKRLNIKGNDEIANLNIEFNLLLEEVSKREIELQNAYFSLKESEIKWQFAIEGNGDGVWDWNIETNQVSFSSIWKTMLGYSSDEIRNDFEAWQELIHPDDIVKAFHEIEKYLSGEINILILEHRLLCKDKSYKWILARGKTIEWDTLGGPLRIIGIHTDISRRKQFELALSESQAQISAVFDNTPDLIFSVNAKDFSLMTFNKSMKVIFAKRLVKLKYGLGLNEMFEGDRLDEWKGYFERALIEGSFTTNYETIDQTQILTLRFNLLRNEEDIFGISVFAKDITKEREAEEEIQKLNNELEIRIQQRTIQLEEANRELESFSYSVSHDLRAPLRHVSGFTDLLLNKFKDILPDKALHYVNNISSSVEQMGNLIEDLLNFSRTAKTELFYSKIEMSEIVYEVIDMLMSNNSKRNIKWQITKLHQVEADRNLIKLVWVNLISNAIKYTGNKEIAEISIWSEISEADITYYIKDNGAGFDMNYADKLFGVFQRLHSNSEFEGTGIGLANARRILSRHSGKIYAISEVNQGATFLFSLPLKRY